DHAGRGEAPGVKVVAAPPRRATRSVALRSATIQRRANRSPASPAGIADGLAVELHLLVTPEALSDLVPVVGDAVQRLLSAHVPREGLREVDVEALEVGRSAGDAEIRELQRVLEVLLLVRVDVVDGVLAVISGIGVVLDLRRAKWREEVVLGA